VPSKSEWKKKRLSTPSNNYIPFIERIFVNNEENGEFGYSVPNKDNIGGTWWKWSHRSSHVIAKPRSCVSLTYLPLTMTSTNPKIFAQDLPTPEPETPCRPRQPYRFSTLCATVENPSQKDQYGSSSVPIYQTATFKGVNGQYDYTRSGNPTRSHLG
jgi:hypothetical protein